MGLIVQTNLPFSSKSRFKQFKDTFWRIGSKTA